MKSSLPFSSVFMQAVLRKEFVGAKSDKLLGRLTAAEFLRRHWQKKPLVVRDALPEFANLVQRETLIELAMRDDLESRVVEHSGQRWRVRHGPFDRRELMHLPRSGWTLLVQGVNHALPAAQRLLDRFAFIPYARLDDLMVSYAPAGGGVGPHFDHYDVFLVQGAGRRRWRISHQRDLGLVSGAPLRILRRFRPTRSWVVGAGDLIYLPPRWAHDGIAIDSGCTTGSIGFRALPAQEVCERFLEYLQDRLRLDGIYSDPELKPARRPAWLDDDLVRKAGRLIERIRWNGADVADFLGRHLTEPKPHVLFTRPSYPLSARAFAVRSLQCGLRLSGPTRMLFRGRAVFINGEACPVSVQAARLLSHLADRRSLPPRIRPDRESARHLYQWYRAGYIHLNPGE